MDRKRKNQFFAVAGFVILLVLGIGAYVQNYNPLRQSSANKGVQPSQPPVMPMSTPVATVPSATPTPAALPVQPVIIVVGSGSNGGCSTATLPSGSSPMVVYPIPTPTVTAMPIPTTKSAKPKSETDKGIRYYRRP
jgi:hypothetical protein